MRNRIILCLLLLIGSVEASSQRTVTCKVVDATLNKPISGALITVADKVITTTTNHLGFFQISVDTTDLIRIQHDNFEIITFTPPPVNSFEVQLEWRIFSFYQDGNEAFYNLIGQNIMYPYSARSTFTQGRVFLSFQIDKSGKLVNMELINDIGKGCGKELMRVIKKIPEKYIPDESNVTYILPVTFRISNYNSSSSTPTVQIPSGSKVLQEIVITATIK